MSTSADAVNKAIRENARQAAAKYPEKLERLAGLMEQANAVWASMDQESRDALTNFHHYDGSLTCCLLKGEQAARELFALVKR